MTNTHLLRVLSEAASLANPELAAELLRLSNMMMWRPIGELPETPEDGMVVEFAAPERRIVAEARHSTWRTETYWLTRSVIITRFTHFRPKLPGPGE